MSRPFSCYVAASAAPSESARVAAVIAALRAAGIHVTCTWPTVVANTPGGSNPRDATQAQRRDWSVTDINEIDEADALLFLVPSPPEVTRGGWFESGYAYANGKHLAFAGDTRQSVFCALGREFETDGAAIIYLRELAARSEFLDEEITAEVAS